MRRYKQILEKQSQNEKLCSVVRTTSTGLTRMVFTLLQTNVIFQLMGHSGVGAYACHQHSGSP